jgi:hypothetical protein
MQHVRRRRPDRFHPRHDRLHVRFTSRLAMPMNNDLIGQDASTVPVLDPCGDPRADALIEFETTP